MPRRKRAACYSFRRSTRSALERAQISLSFMSHPATFSIARDPLPDHEQKQAALSYLNEAWAEARHDGVDGDCLAQASLFTALAELVSTYGEDAVGEIRRKSPEPRSQRRVLAVAGEAVSESHKTGCTSPARGNCDQGG